MSSEQACHFCGKDINEVDGCEPIMMVDTNNKVYKSIRFGQEKEWKDSPVIPASCDECNCKTGEYHHSGCKQEECPICGDKLALCECQYEELDIENNETLKIQNRSIDISITEYEIKKILEKNKLKETPESFELAYRILEESKDVVKAELLRLLNYGIEKALFMEKSLKK